MSTYQRSNLPDPSRTPREFVKVGGSGLSLTAAVRILWLDVCVALIASGEVIIHLSNWFHSGN